VPFHLQESEFSSPDSCLMHAVIVVSDSLDRCCLGTLNTVSAPLGREIALDRRARVALRRMYDNLSPVTVPSERIVFDAGSTVVKGWRRSQGGRDRRTCSSAEGVEEALQLRMGGGDLRSTVASLTGGIGNLGGGVGTKRRGEGDEMTEGGGAADDAELPQPKSSPRPFRVLVFAFFTSCGLWTSGIVGSV
jgi:hypothetical protein